MTTTPNIKLTLPEFDVSPWHDDVNNNFAAIDAIFKSTFGIEGLLGEWKNSTGMVVGDRYYDVAQGFYYECLVNHVSAAFPTTFAANRLSNPTYWKPLDASEAIQAVADAQTVYADVLVSQGIVNTDKGIVAADKAIVAADKGIVAADKGIVAADKATVAANLVSVTTLYDQFDDRYLGAKAANPALDNDGAALLTGALYFNSTVGEMRVWNGVAWVAAYITDANYQAFRAGAEQEDLGAPSVGSRRAVPNGLWRSGAASTIGVLKIKLPLLLAASGQWIAFWVDVHDYATEETRSFFVGGYIFNGGSPSFLNVSANQVGGNKPITVQFGDDGTNRCITFGEATDTWGYPIVRIRDVIGNTGANWNTLSNNNWEISVTPTVLTTVSAIKTIGTTIPETFGVSDTTSNADDLTDYGGWYDKLAAVTMTNLPAARNYHLEYLRHSATLGLQVAWPSYNNTVDAPYLRRNNAGAWSAWRQLAWDDEKADLASPALTGVPTAPTAAALTNTTQLATTAFVTTADNLKANLASPTFTGVPAAPTAAALTNTTQIATTAFVTTADNLKANLASPALTGTPTAPTAAPLTNTTQVATTAFVRQEVNAVDHGAGNAALAYGAIGTYVWAYRFGTGITAGATYAGSTLEPAGHNGAEASAIADDSNSTTPINFTKGGAALTGTWRAMSQSNITGGSNLGRYALFLRIS